MKIVVAHSINPDTHFTVTLLTATQNATAEKCAACSMQQDPPARTMVRLFSAEGNKMQQLFTFALSMVRVNIHFLQQIPYLLVVLPKNVLLLINSVLQVFHFFSIGLIV